MTNVNIPPPPISVSWGPVISWNGGVATFGQSVPLVVTGLTAAPARTPLPGVTNVFTSAQPGGVALLPVGIVSGTIVVENDDLVNPVLVVPPSGARINNFAVGQGVYVSALGGWLPFSTNNPTTQWWAPASFGLIPGPTPTTQASLKFNSGNNSMYLGAV